MDHSVMNARSDLPQSSAENGAARQQSYRALRHTTEQLAAPLSAEDCALQSMPDASPTKWHLAHTSWFFETFVLSASLPGYRAFHPQFRALFNSYYNAVGDKHPRPERGMISRPSLDEIYAYRRHVDAAMLQWLTAAQSREALALFTLGVNHEQQHQELILMDIKHLLSRNPLHPAYSSTPVHSAGADAAPLHWHAHAAGLHEVGHAATGSGDGTGFAFDNEGPRHQIWLADFALASRLVTNGEYLQFMQDGGYSRAELWLAEGWDTVNAQQWHAPLYWLQRDGQWQHFTLHGLQPIAPSDPVQHVSFFEAEAFAQWASQQSQWQGARLPTEFEWEVAAAQQTIAGNFLDQRALRALPAKHKSSGPQQLYGDLWEWTRSAYAPYPGFRPAAGAVGEYNGKFMANQYVLRGGSFATPRDHIRATYRNFFPAHTRWQFSGIRLAR
jgi:ergothioneine biosynthesis protein EgtB